MQEQETAASRAAPQELTTGERLVRAILDHRVPCSGSSPERNTERSAQTVDRVRSMVPRVARAA